MALGILKKIPIYPIFYLLKGDYSGLGFRVGFKGLGFRVGLKGLSDIDNDVP